MCVCERDREIQIERERERERETDRQRGPKREQRKRASLLTMNKLKGVGIFSQTHIMLFLILIPISQISGDKKQNIEQTGHQACMYHLR